MFPDNLGKNFVAGVVGSVVAGKFGDLVGEAVDASSAIGSATAKGLAKKAINVGSELVSGATAVISGETLKKNHEK